EWVRGLRLTYHRPGDVHPRDLTEEQRRDGVVAAFKYWNMPTPERPGKPAPPRPGKPPPAPVPLELELTPIKGSVETHVEHTLKLQRAEQGWQGLAGTRGHAPPLYTRIDAPEGHPPPGRPRGAHLLP